MIFLTLTMLSITRSYGKKPGFTWPPLTFAPLVTLHSNKIKPSHLTPPEASRSTIKRSEILNYSKAPHFPRTLEEIRFCHASSMPKSQSPFGLRREGGRLGGGVRRSKGE